MKHPLRAPWRPIWLDFPLRTKGMAIVGLPIAALIVGLALLAATNRREQNAQRWVDHTIEVRHKLNLIMTDLLAAESSARAFAIAAQPDLLPQIESARSDAHRRIQELEELIKDNPEQRR